MLFGRYFILGGNWILLQYNVGDHHKPLKVYSLFARCVCVAQSRVCSLLCCSHISSLIAFLSITKCRVQFLDGHRFQFFLASLEGRYHNRYHNGRSDGTRQHSRAAGVFDDNRNRRFFSATYSPVHCFSYIPLFGFAANGDIGVIVMPSMAIKQRTTLYARTPKRANHLLMMESEAILTGLPNYLLTSKQRFTLLPTVRLKLY